MPEHHKYAYERLKSHSVAANELLQEGEPIFYYQPFSMTDLLNWKHHTPSYSEKPQALVDLRIHLPDPLLHLGTLPLGRQLLLTLFNTEDCKRVRTEA